MIKTPVIPTSKGGRTPGESGPLRLLDDPEVFNTVLQIKDAFFEHGDKESLRCFIKAITFCCTECGGKLQDFAQIKLKEPVGSINEIIEVMGDKVGKSLKVVVKRANNSLVTLYVVPKEANPDS